MIVTATIPIFRFLIANYIASSGSATFIRLMFMLFRLRGHHRGVAFLVLSFGMHSNYKLGVVKCNHGEGRRTAALWPLDCMGVLYVQMIINEITEFSVMKKKILNPHLLLVNKDGRKNGSTPNLKQYAIYIGNGRRYQRNSDVYHLTYL